MFTYAYEPLKEDASNASQDHTPFLPEKKNKDDLWKSSNLNDKILSKSKILLHRKISDFRESIDTSLEMKSDSFFTDTFLNNLTATQVQTIDINLYLQICESNPEKIFTKQYIHWYLLKDQSHFMTNELEDEVHFSCKMARISPNESHIVFACYDKSIIVWDYIKHQTVHIPLKTHKSTKITCLAFSSNGHKIASISSKNTFVIWDIHTTSQNNLLSYEGLKEGIKCLAFSNDDTKVALGSKEGNLIVYDTFNGQIIMGPLPGHEAKVKCVAFSPNNTKICTGGQDKIILLWDVESKQMIKRLKGHRNEVLSLVFDPMGEIIVSGGKDKNVLIWDVAKGRELFDPLKGHKNAISIIAMAPNGLRFASGGRDKMIIFWDLTMGHIIFGPLEGHQKKIEDLRYSSDSKCLFSASIDNSVIIWDADKGIILKKPLQSYSIKSSVRAITPNGLTMIVANGRKDENDGSFTIWNALTAQPSGVSIKAHTDSIKAMVCSPNNKLLITGGKDRKIIVWNLEKTNEVLYGPLEEHKDEITCLAYASDNKTFASGSRIAELKVWDTFKGTPFPFEFSGHSGRITTLEFDIQGEKLISGDHFHNVNVWSVQSGKNLLSYTHLTPITASTFSFDSNKVVTGSEDGQIKIWDLREKEPQPKNLQAHKKGITAIVFSHDGLKIATASKNVEIKVWDCAKKVVLFIGPLAGHHFPIYHLLFSDDDSFLNSASSDCSKTWKIWCVSSEKTFPIEYTFDVSPDGRWIVAPGKENTDLLIYNSLKGYALYHIMRSHLNKVNFAFFSPDSQRILSGSDDCSLMLWDSISGKPALGPLKGHSGPVYVGTFSRSGNKIASGGSDKTIILWDGKTGKPLFEQALRGHTDDIYTMEFSADEMRLVSGGDDGKIIVWDCLDGTMLFDPIEAHEDWITCVKFSWDGIKLYSSSFDTTIKVWNSDSGELLDTLKAHNQSVYSIKFSPDHNKMVSVSNDRKAIIWDSNSRCNCQFSRERVFQTGVKAVHWSDNDDLFFVFDEEIKCYFNYFSNEELFFSKGLILSDFYRDPERFSDDELMSILDGNIGEIVPFYYTFLHVVAYTDDHQRFFQSRILKLLKIKNKTIDFLAFFKKDIHNNSCVDIILKKNNKNLMRIVFKYIAKSYRPSELYAHGFADKITVNLLYQILMIFGNDTSLIIKLIDMCFDTPVDYPDLFTFKGFDEEFSLAIKEPKINAHKIEDIINMNDSEKKGWLDQILSKENPFPTQEIIIAKTFYLKDILNLDKGVALDFFRKISSLDSDNPIFANETFKKIIHHKWDSYASKIYFTQATWFLIMIIFYIINANFILPERVAEGGLDEDYWDDVSLILDIIVLLFVFRYAFRELSQMWAFGFVEYFLSLWNYIDIILILMLSGVIAFDIMSCIHYYVNVELLKVWHAYTIFISFVRFISFSRGIQGTSFMIRLVIQVIIDIQSFLILMLLFILALACSTYMLQTDLSSDHFSTFNTFFREMLGDLTDYDELDVVNAYALWVFFFIASLVLSIVLLNLLIAIISDTFGNVKSNEDLARHFEMCNIIYDIDAELMVDKPTEYYMIVYAETGDKDLKNPLEILKEKIVFSTQMVKNIDYHLEKVLNKDGGSGYSVNHPSKKKKVA